MLESIREDYGLNKPVLTQLWIYISGVATGNLGESFFFNQPVSKLIAARIGPTILLVISAQIISIVLGVFLGVIAARKPNGVMSAFVSVFAGSSNDATDYASFNLRVFNAVRVLTVNAALIVSPRRTVRDRHHLKAFSMTSLEVPRSRTD